MSSHRRAIPLLVLLLLLLTPTIAAAQGVIRGRIRCTNPYAEVSAATILIRGSSPLIYTTMQEDGTFLLEAPEGRQVVEVRSLGFVSRE